MGHLHDVSQLPFDDGNLAVEQQQEARHKFGFPEFDGAKGYSLLSDILAAILPMSLHLTWLALTRVQKDEKNPYGGIGYLMQSRARSDRKMEMDLKSFKDRGLMTTTPGIEYIAGQARRVDYKDFGNLYELAHKYRTWTHTNDFLLYQPSFEDADSIRHSRLSDLSEMSQKIIYPHESLYDFLIQFENYRLKLECGKPGPKGPKKSSGSTIDSNQSDECITRMNGHVEQKPKCGFVATAPYETISSITNSIEDSNDTSSKKNPLIASFEHPNIPESLDVVPQEQEKSADGCKTSISNLSAQDKANAYIESAVVEEDRKQATPRKERYERAKASEALRRKYPEIVKLCAHFANKFYDMGGKSTLTDICSLFEKSQMSEQNFIELMEYAGLKTAGKPESGIKVRNLDGKANKMPYFMKIIRNAIDAGLSVLQLEEADRERAGSVTPELSTPETPKDIKTSVHSDILSSSNPAVEGAQVPAHDVPTAYKRAVGRACKDIYMLLKTVQQTVRLWTEYGHDCSFCGCPILLVEQDDAGRDLAYCVACQPDPAWPGGIPDQVRAILSRCLCDDPIPQVDQPRASDSDQIALLKSLKDLELKRQEEERQRFKNRQ